MDGTRGSNDESVIAADTTALAGSDRDSFAPFLDHAMIMLDGATYRDILASEFLRDFGRLKEKQGMSSTVGAFSCIGVAGRHTLVQFFDLRAPAKLGFTAGLVFAFETPGQITEAGRRLAEHGVEVEYELGRIGEPDEPGGAAPPAYHMLWLDVTQQSPVSFTFDEACPELFDQLGAARGPAGEFYRRTYLDAVLGAPHQPHHQFGDITAATLRLKPARAHQAASALEALGYKAASEPDGTTLYGPDFAVHLCPDTGNDEGLLSLQIALARPDESARTHVFGNSSVLTLSADGTARWTFTPVRSPSAL